MNAAKAQMSNTINFFMLSSLVIAATISDAAFLLGFCRYRYGNNNGIGFGKRFLYDFHDALLCNFFFDNISALVFVIYDGGVSESLRDAAMVEIQNVAYPFAIVSDGAPLVNLKIVEIFEVFWDVQGVRKYFVFFFLGYG
ncbi:hypothetical protein [uncultured Fibrobacter sp.]|uniref:hypothetical protein n=1 Tax=uncultured Fibrobacter sp. TaxID=261512 RepID=UPI00262A3652|nr:hypothetical protein [uncultured Fibrobacter sp.]